jgi:hypothetical protein
MTPRFTLDDMDRAHAAWGANCGPSALAVICGLTLDEVRPHVESGGPFPGYTNPTLMLAALRSVGVTWRPRAIRDAATGQLPWPRWGLARIQWHGRWMEPGVPIAARYRHTHWVGAATRANGDVGVWDVNALGNGSGWCALADWERVLVPAITGEIRGASGGWERTHVIEVGRRKS